MAQFRKKPVVIEAVQVPPKWNGEGVPMEIAQLAAFMGADGPWQLQSDGTIAIKTLEGIMQANIGDWIIRGVKGEFYPCKPDIFAATYEAV